MRMRSEIRESISREAARGGRRLEAFRWYIILAL